MLDESEMYFHLVGSTEPLPPTMTCKELGASEIVLSKKKNRTARPHPMAFFLIFILGCKWELKNHQARKDLDTYFGASTKRSATRYV